MQITRNLTRYLGGDTTMQNYPRNALFSALFLGAGLVGHATAATIASADTGTPVKQKEARGDAPPFLHVAHKEVASRPWLSRKTANRGQSRWSQEMPILLSKHGSRTAALAAARVCTAAGVRP